MLPAIRNWVASNINFKYNRNISSSPIRCDDSKLTGKTYKVNNFEKRVLVWFGKYKTVEEVPAFVAPETVEKARSRMRIRISNITIVLTLIGCMAMVYTGKKARERGDTIQKRNLDWHKMHEEKDAAVKAAQAK